MYKNIPEFGIKRNGEERRDGGAAVVFYPKTGKFAVGIDEKGHMRLFSGGVEKGESRKDGALRELLEESGLDDYEKVEKIADVVAHFHNNVRNVDRVASAVCYLVVLKSDHNAGARLEAHEKFTLHWTNYGEIISNWESRNWKKDYDHWIYFMQKAYEKLKELGYKIPVKK